MRKARYFIRCTIEHENAETEVRNCYARYATLKSAREALKRLAEANIPDMTYRFSKDKKKLYRWFGETSRHVHTILDIKLLQSNEHE